MLGKLKWLIPQDELYGMCSEHINEENEVLQLELEAGVTNAENGQLVRAFASTILHKRNIRMDFSLPSPAVIHPDMPFMAWVIINTFRIFFSLNSTLFCRYGLREQMDTNLVWVNSNH